MWQRGESPNGAGAADLALWEGNFGATASVAAIVGVPEPSAMVLLGMTLAGFAGCGTSIATRREIEVVVA